TIPSRNCDVLMTLPDTTNDDVIMWLVTRLRARVPELVLHLRHHNKMNEFGFYLTATNENLLKGADELAIKKPVKSEFGGGFKEFVYDDREFFEGALDNVRCFLNSEERQSIIRHLLMNLRAQEGDEVEGIKFLEGQAL
ncbi:hypothetical protein HELRODRAFT_144788, partial [Helobdella robusta]|uniref:Uncharacterized protein n=1 Tax=Helobdella robusta TaxID=6412 RepID=T1EJG4_HELRO